MSRGRRLLLLVPPRMIQFWASSATYPWMFQSGGRRLLLLGPPRTLRSGASGLSGAAWPRLLFAVAPRPPLGLRLCASPLAPGASCAAWVRLGERSPPGWVLLGTASRAVVVWLWRVLSGFAAPGGRCCSAPVRVLWLWLAACLSGVPRGPALVRRASSGPVALGALVSFPDAVVLFPSPGGFAPRFTGRLRWARGGRPRTGLFVPAAGPRRGRGAGLAPRRTRLGPRDGVGPGGSLRRRSRAACAAVVGVCGPGH